MIKNDKYAAKIRNYTKNYTFLSFLIVRKEIANKER